jgi:hypothetical protein
VLLVEYAIALIVLLCVVALVVLSPLLQGRSAEAPQEGLREALEAAKEAKYREIRDAELDLQMGKLSVEDHRSVDRELRAEAIEILRRLDELEGKAPPG